MAQFYFEGRRAPLAGRRLEPGDHAPDFSVVGPAGEVRLSDFRGRLKLIVSVPSLDIPLWAGWTGALDRRMRKAAKRVSAICISMDLPFAQKRFCERRRIGTMEVFSDHRFSSFGATYGILIERFRLLAPGIFIIDLNDILRYVRVAQDADAAPDLGAVSAALDEVVRNPAAPEPAFPWRCIPCENNSLSLAPERLDVLLAEAHDWKRGGRGITKEFSFRDFGTAMDFAGIVSAVGKEEGYSPGLDVTGNRLRVSLGTDGGLTENEFIMSRIIDEIQF